jgi:hypothetical protein
MDKTVEVIALYASATQNALVTLSKCLMDNGALKGTVLISNQSDT